MIYQVTIQATLRVGADSDLDAEGFVRGRLQAAGLAGRTSIAVECTDDLSGPILYTDELPGWEPFGPGDDGRPTGYVRRLPGGHAAYVGGGRWAVNTGQFRSAGDLPSGDTDGRAFVDAVLRGVGQ